MNFLFMHNNFPAQFHRLSVALAARAGHRVVFLSCFKRQDVGAPGVEWRQIVLSESERNEQKVLNHPPTFRQGELFANAMLALQREGFVPDVIHGHVGFGSMLYAQDIFPRAVQAGYFEWFYTEGADVAFFGGRDKLPMGMRQAQRHSNLCVLSALEGANFGICPTIWQRDQHPSAYHNKLHVIHDGVDTDFFSPHPAQRFQVEGVDLADAEIVTYATRGLEPYRGFHTLYRSLPAVLAARPKARVLIMANDRSVYGQNRSDGKSWREALQDEVDVDESRVHFLPFQSYPQYRGLLRAARVHVYLTAPFVLSWSMLEAMSCGCLVVASDTEPVLEVMRHGQNGLLTGFADHEQLAQRIIEGLARWDHFAPLRNAARQTVLSRYALGQLLPRQIRLFEGYPAMR